MERNFETLLRRQPAPHPPPGREAGSPGGGGQKKGCAHLYLLDGGTSLAAQTARQGGSGSPSRGRSAATGPTCRRGFMGRLAAALAFFLVAGCAAVGPNYVPPEPTTVAEWHAPLEGGITAAPAELQTLAAWWATLNDPDLSELMERAVAGNLDLQQARARIWEARARRGVSRAELLPTLDASAAGTKNRRSTDGASPLKTKLFTAGFDAGWELDIFGGVRRSVEAAEANLQATREDLHDVLVSLLAETALNYTDVRTYQARLAAAEENLRLQSETYQLVDWRRQAGLADELAVEQARYNLESTRAQLPALRTGLEEAQNRLAVLLGEPPGAVSARLATPKPIPVTPPEIAVGVPADVLRQRPDIRRAERELAAQTARIGVATAELYPKFTLSGTIGIETPSLDDLFSPPTHTSGFGAAVRWRLFDGGAVRSGIEVQEALREQYLTAYRSAVLGAFEEAENAIVAYTQEQRRRAALRETLAAARQAAALARHKYEAGLADFTAVLDAERALRAFEDQLAQSEGAVTSDLVRLYKALGGGWSFQAGDGADRRSPPPGTARAPAEHKGSPAGGPEHDS